MARTNSTSTEAPKRPSRRRTPRLHIDPATGATVAEGKGPTGQRAVKDAMQKKAARVTKASLVVTEFEKGASLTEAAKATGVDPAYVWDIAAVWEKRTGTRVPRTGHTPKPASK